MTARAARFKEVDLTRAIKAANKAGAWNVRVEFDPDGRMIVITGEAAKLPAQRNSFD